jgi:hypothetical protein
VLRALAFKAWSGRLGFLALFFALALLSGCSTTRLYNNADRLLAWRADSLLGLSAEQRGTFRDDLGPVLAWQRQTQLPRWADALERLALAVEDDAVTPVLVETLEADLRADVAELTRALAPPALTLLRGLDEAQVAALPERFAEEDADLNEDYEGLALEAQRAEWARALEEGLEDWVGRLTPGQRAAIGALSQEIRPDNAAWMAYRRAWQRAFLDALDRRDSPWFAAVLPVLMVQRSAFYTPAYAAQRARNDPAYSAFFPAFLGSLTPSQRDRLSGKLRDLSEDFAALAAQGAA